MNVYGEEKEMERDISDGYWPSGVQFGVASIVT
jgi:hypothetical protein